MYHLFALVDDMSLTFIEIRLPFPFAVCKYMC